MSLAAAVLFGILCFCHIVHAADQGQLPEGQGKRIVVTACTSCHDLAAITEKKCTRDEWTTLVKRMVTRGASLSNDETATVVNYLTRNFGKQDRGRELFEDVCTSCHDVRRVESRRLSREDWRDLTKGMLSEGFVLTDEETSLILDYLAKHYGENDR